MNDLRAHCKFRAVSRNTVIEAYPEGDNHIRIVHGHGGRIVPVHALHPEKPRMVGRNCGKSHEGTADRRIDLFGKSEDFVFCVCRDHAAAEVNEGAFRRIDDFCRFFDAHILCGKGAVFLRRRLRLIVTFGNLHILGNVDQHRSGSAGFGKPESFADGIRQISNISDKIIVLGDGQSHARDVDFLKAVHPDLCGRYIAADCHHGDGVEIGGSNAGYKVCRTGTRCRNDHADLSRGSCISVSCMGGTLFMCGQHVIDFVLIFIKAVIYV